MRLFYYYLAIILPLLFIAFVVPKLGLGSGAFVVGIISYYFYRCFLDFYKLKAQNVVTKNDWPKFIFGGWSFMYFKELYFK